VQPGSDGGTQEDIGKDHNAEQRERESKNLKSLLSRQERNNVASGLFGGANNQIDQWLRNENENPRYEGPQTITAKSILAFHRITV
jgi:hypothetical protein